MKKRLSCLLMSAAMLCATGIGCACIPTAKKAAVQEESTAAVESVKDAALQYAVTSGESAGVSTDYNSPLVTLRADPFLYKDKDTGKYYFTGSYPKYDRIELTCADSVNGISAAVPKTIWEQPKVSYTSYVWAPEIHKVLGKWVVYFTLSDGSEWNIRSCALVCEGDDPMTDEWKWADYLTPAEGDTFAIGRFSLDMTAFEHNGRWYVAWAQQGPQSNIYLAELETPTKLKTHALLLTKPEYSWELDREPVNEGPAVFKHAGKIYLTYSGAATGYEYCMGLLEIDDDKDLLVKENWKKYDKPVFKTDPILKVYGPGHNNFVEGDQGELLCVLHFRNYRDIVGGNGNSLYDYNRHAHVMEVKFDETGMPVFHYDPDDIYNVDFTNHIP